MQRNSLPPRAERGDTLIVALVMVIVLAGMAAALMRVVHQDHQQTVTASVYARIQYIAEAGVSHAIEDLTSGGTGNIASSSYPRAFGGGGYYATSTDNGDGTWTVRCVANLSRERRALETVLAPKDIQLFKKALFGDLDLAAKGNVFTDSYDSDVGTYISQATNTDPVTGMIYARPKGSLGSNGNIIVNGTVTILGDATPGPGKSVMISGGSAYIAGSTTPAPTTTQLPLIEYPPGTTTTTSFATSGAQVFTAGTYHYHDFTAKAKAEVRFQGDVTLYVDDVFNVSGQAQFIVEPGASVTIYHDGSDFSLTGGGMLNQSGVPANFKLYSRATSVSFGGNASFYGAVYAPRATIDPGGTTDIFGSFVGSRVVINGSANFHYDEMLSKSPDSISYLRPVSWKRISPNLLP